MSDANTWLRLTIEAAADDEDALTQRLNEAVGGAGVEVLDHTARGLLPELGELPAGRILLRAYVEAGSDPVRIDLSDFPTAHMHPIEPLDDDWKTRWKDFFHATRVGERFVVRPPWEPLDEPTPPGALEVIIEPGMAFGTGTHETTRLCIRALEGLVEPGARVLDVGCGSGILSIASAKLGASPIVAIDIDPPSIAATLENAAANGVAGRIESSTRPLATIEGAWDLVLANILSSILVTLRDGLVSRVAPDGRLVLSGILTTEADDVSAEFTAAGMVEIDRLQDANWAALILRHGP